MRVVTGPVRRAWSDPSFRRLLWLTLGAIGWLGVLGLMTIGLAASPPKAGFDLRLVLDAGARVATGASPYDPALIDGSASLKAQDLFYSYPPPVAQLAAPVSGVPLGVALLVLGGLAVAGAFWVARRLSRLLDPAGPTDEVALATVAVLPYVFPFSVALVFGNLDALYPLAYGALLLAVLAPGGGAIVVGGVALAAMSVAKIHPGILGLWLLVRGTREWRAGHPLVAWRILAVAIVAGVIIVGLSIAIGGLQPWRDYVDVVRTISGADLVLANNVGPAAQIAYQLGLGEDAARLLQVPVLVLAIAMVVLAGWYRGDPLESLAYAAVASLVVLPVTWYHYPAALIPFGLAALLRDGRTEAAARVRGWVAAATALAIASIAMPVLVLLALGAVILATRGSRPSSQGLVEA